jgi:hypothetical protein
MGEVMWEHCMKMYARRTENERIEVTYARDSVFL